MTWPMLLLLALGLSMDAFAVSVSNGICFQRYTPFQRFLTALSFGGFQGLMPVLGYLAGSTVLHLIEQLDHYIALILLGYLGGRMIWEALSQIRNPENDPPPLCFSCGQLLVQSVATSIDALAVGITLAALEVNIAYSAGFIAAVTFLCCLAGVGLGRRFGLLLKARAGLLGGGILVFIGLKIFIDHQFFGG